VHDPTPLTEPTGTSHRQVWRRWDDIAHLLRPDRAAEGWADDRAKLHESPVDPWARQGQPAR
jgi:hypothetical protein